MLLLQLNIQLRTPPLLFQEAALEVHPPISPLFHPRHTFDCKTKHLQLKPFLDQRSKTPPISADCILNQPVTGCEVAMNNAISFTHENIQLRAVNKKKQTWTQ